MIKGNLIPNLRKFGLSENEAKAYAGLVFLREASARELHSITSIPRAKVYEILGNLVEKRYAEELQGTPVHYKATDPEDLVQMLREDYEETASEILKSFEEMDYRPFGEDEDLTSIQYLRSEWTIHKKMNELLDETNKNLIILSRSPAVMKEIESDLIAVKKRLNILILVNSLDGYENYSLPVVVYPESVRSLLLELEESHIANQSCNIISDVKKLLAIRKDGTKMEAHYISQSVVDFIYKSIYYFVTNADSIQLPESFGTSESAGKKHPEGKASEMKNEPPEKKKRCCKTSFKNKFKKEV
jgi:Predicted transcriptional regulators